MPQMSEQTFKLQAGDLNFRVFDQGEGDIVVLLHGFPDNLLMWEPTANDLLERGYRVIAYDQRGYGESDMPIGLEHYKVQTIANDLSLILDALGVDEPVNVIGHDWGAAVAWAFATFHADRVKSSVVVSVGHITSYARAGFVQKFIKGFYFFWFQIRHGAEAYLKRGGLRLWCLSHPDYQSVRRDMSREGRLTAGLSWYRANLIDGLTTTWPNCQVPTLGIWSSKDRFLTEAQMKASEKYMDAPFKYARIEDCAHWVPIEKPRELVALACQWFTEAKR